VMIWNNGWAWWQGGLMWLAMIAFWALVAWLIYALVTSGRRTRQPERGEERRGGDARSILDERLARGEIDLEEYRRLRDAIADDRTSHAGGRS